MMHFINSGRDLIIYRLHFLELNQGRTIERYMPSNFLRKIAIIYVRKVSKRRHSPQFKIQKSAANISNGTLALRKTYNQFKAQHAQQVPRFSINLSSTQNVRSSPSKSGMNNFLYTFKPFAIFEAIN